MADAWRRYAWRRLPCRSVIARVKLDHISLMLLDYDNPAVGAP